MGSSEPRADSSGEIKVARDLLEQLYNVKLKPKGGVRLE
jgi:hypothetical protein